MVGVERDWVFWLALAGFVGFMAAFLWWTLALPAAAF